MTETGRLLEAAHSLSQVLGASGTPHAFHGNFLAALLTNQSQSDEIYCIVEGGGQSKSHPFRRVRDAVAGNEDFKLVHSPWTNRLHVTYRNLIPAIEIEILVAGETGPRNLNASNVTRVQGVPVLSVSEFIRARLRSWMIRRTSRDAEEITIVMSGYWSLVDINRIPEQDMSQFVSANPDASPAWNRIRRKYGT